MFCVLYSFCLCPLPLFSFPYFLCVLGVSLESGGDSPPTPLKFLRGLRPLKLPLQILACQAALLSGGLGFQAALFSGGIGCIELFHSYWFRGYIYIYIYIYTYTYLLLLGECLGVHDIVSAQGLSENM